MMHTLMLKESAISGGGSRRSRKNCLMVFYSLTGTTQTVAQKIALACDCDIEEILDVRPRTGFFGYLKSGFEAITKTLPAIKPITNRPADYELVILGTPVWASNISSPMRSYIVQNAEYFRRVATFCTMRGSGGNKVLGDIATLCDKRPVAQLALTEEQVKNNGYLDGVTSFAVSLAGYHR